MRGRRDNTRAGPSSLAPDAEREPVQGGTTLFPETDKKGPHGRTRHSGGVRCCGHGSAAGVADAPTAGGAPGQA